MIHPPLGFRPRRGVDPSNPGTASGTAAKGISEKMAILHSWQSSLDHTLRRRYGGCNMSTVDPESDAVLGFNRGCPLMAFGAGVSQLAPLVLLGAHVYGIVAEIAVGAVEEPEVERLHVELLLGRLEWHSWCGR